MDAVGGGGCWRLPAMPIQHRVSMKSRVSRGLTGLASHKAAQKDQEQKTELEHGFLVRVSQGKNLIASDICN